jgi:hypothetical protein
MCAAYCYRVAENARRENAALLIGRREITRARIWGVTLSGEAKPEAPVRTEPHPTNALSAPTRRHADPFPPGRSLTLPRETDWLLASNGVYLPFPPACLPSEPAKIAFGSKLEI